MKATNNILKIIVKYVLLLLGSAVAAVGLEIFLVPNNIIVAELSVYQLYLAFVETAIGLVYFIAEYPIFVYWLQTNWKSLL